MMPRIVALQSAVAHAAQALAHAEERARLSVERAQAELRDLQLLLEYESQHDPHPQLEQIKRTWRWQR